MGILNIAKKKALTKSKLIEVLWTYSLLSFILVCFEFNSAIQVDKKYVFFALLKAICMFTSWTLSAYCIKKLPISLHGILNLSRIVFLTILGIVFLNEMIVTNQIMGMVIVIIGLMLVNLKDEDNYNEQDKNVKFRYVLLMIISCVFASFSGLLDKILMQDMKSGQLQFWTMLFIIVLYTIYSIVKKEKISIKSISKNYWIILMAICLVVGDRALFFACSIPESKLSVISLLKQSGVIVTVLAGGKIFKEKNLVYKFFCTLIVLFGIALVVITE